MVRGIRRVSVEKGYDPRDFALVAFGGRDPSSCRTGQSDEHETRHRPALSGDCIRFRHALRRMSGMIMCDGIEVADQLNLEELNALYREMESHAVRQLAVEGFHGSKVELLRRVDMRYVGQSYELSIQAPGGPITAEIISTLIDDYHRSHELAYGYARQGEKVEVVNPTWSLRQTSRSEIVGKWPSQGTPPQPVGRRPVLFEGRGCRSNAHLSRDHLLQGRPLPAGHCRAA